LGLHLTLFALWEERESRWKEQLHPNQAGEHVTDLPIACQLFCYRQFLTGRVI
jgi:hypothetical protein